MLILLYVALAWIAVDVVVVAAWHRAHVVARRGRLVPVVTPSMSPRVFSSAPAAHPRSAHAPLPARPDYFQLIDA